MAFVTHTAAAAECRRIQDKYPGTICRPKWDRTGGGGNHYHVDIQDHRTYPAGGNFRAPSPINVTPGTIERAEVGSSDTYIDTTVWWA